MMKILFVHQNAPGQYRELLRVLVDQKVHEIVFLTQKKDIVLEGVQLEIYAPFQAPAKTAFGLSRDWEEATRTGFGAARAAERLRDGGFTPDIIIGHCGWGELLFLKDVWPDVPVLGYFEYYYSMTGGLAGFDPEVPISPQAAYFARARNAVPLASLGSVDLCMVPTRWQRDRFPPLFHDRMYVCHDGIRCDLLRPDAEASLQLGRLSVPLSRQDEVITYVARNLERARGFHILMRALPGILEKRPQARILIVGGTETSYGAKNQHPGGLRGEMEDELGARIDWSRVHFLGRVPYSQFCRIIQISRCHLYLSMPFVLSWSLLEAMSMQATVVAADLAPVREAIRHGETGLLVDFFDHEALARQVCDVLDHPAAYAHLGPAARSHVMAEYDFMTKCLPEHIARINSLVATQNRITL